VSVLHIRYSRHGQGALAQAPANGRYAVADVSIKVASGTYPFNVLYFNYQAQGGRTYSPFDGNGTTAGFEPSLSAGDLHAGQSSRGLVTFDVPRGPGQDIQLTDPLGSVVGE